MANAHPNKWVEVIRAAINAQVGVMVEEEILAAQERVSKRLHECIASTVMAAMQYYDVVSDRNGIVITVRDGNKPDT